MRETIKIEYVRTMQFGFMRIWMQTSLKKIEEEMLTHNQIEGFLPIDWQQENDAYVLRYNITGKQALDGILEHTMADEKLLKSLVVGICVAIRQLEKYLLSQDGLLLLPETIFWDYKTETMYFCYYPECVQSLQEQFVALLEYMLAKVDHKNTLAVQLIYGIYEEAQKPSFCIKELQEFLNRQYEEEEEEIQEEELVNEQEVQENEVVKNTAIDFEHWKAWAITWKQKIIEKVKNKIIKQRKNDVSVLYETLEEEAHATTILEKGEVGVKGILKYEGENLLPDICISKVPFVIGTADDCDAMINHPSISRHHAKITYQENEYWIEDLNSTNGTSVNGKWLSYKTKMSLRKNETLYFADELYRFL